MERAAIIVLAGVITCIAPANLDAQTLKGSRQAMQRQNRVAIQHDFTFLQTAAQVRRFVDAGYLVELEGNDDYELATVSYPFARPAVRTFVERLASQYRAACGEKLVVTSLTRPASEQPGNAHALSVHPAGMAVDLRISQRAACRNWLERTLLSLERQGVLDAIRESRPPHYHVALFPEPYTRYLARLSGGQTSTRLASVEAPARTPAGGGRLVATLDPGSTSVGSYRVNRGDTLWSIARRHGTSVDALRELNGLNGTRLVAGQVIAVPLASADEET